MSTTHESVLAQYEKNQKATSGNKVSQEDRDKKYFTTVLPKGSKGEERRIRILPTKDNSSPFVEVYFHEVKIDGKWYKLFDPKQQGKRSPLNEVYEALNQGSEADKVLARDWRAKKFYIVKVIDRDNEQDGPKFWRFKHNSKGDGIFDKIFPIWKNKGDVSDVKKGRDLVLTLSLTKSGKGSDYTVVSSILPEDPSPLHTDAATAKEWISDSLVWSDVYSIKPEEYLEIVARGEVPRWDSVTGKYVSSSYTSGEENFGNVEKNGATTKSATKVETVADPQASSESDDDLPF